MPKVLVSRPLPEPALAALRAADVTLDINDVDSALPRAELLQRVHDCAGLVSTLVDRIDAELFAAAPQLRVVANVAVGYDNIDVPAATARGVVVCNTPDVLTDATADLTWGLILAACRRVVEADRYARSGAWKAWSPSLLLGREVSGKTLGLAGFGRIGKAVARRAVGFGMRVLYSCRRRRAPHIEAALHAEYVDKDTLLAQSDVLSVHLPLTAETHHYIGAAELARMKPAAVLVNTARGAIIDEAALGQALDGGTLAAVGLDVYEDEPHIAEALLRHDNAVLLPHIGSATIETRTAMASLAVQNCLAVLHGEAPPAAVSP